MSPIGAIIRDAQPVSRVRPESGTESAQRTPTLGLAETPTAHSPTWEELTRWISPRRVVRVDSNGDHTYARVHYVAAGEPQVPYALHLTTTSHRYAHVVFDLDTGRHPDGVGAVWRDADLLLEHLEAQSLEYVVAESGPTGGIHVWVPVSDEDGLDADDVARLARTVAHHLPSLDIGMLTSPAKGAVRPPGAPHRHGGRSRLLHPATADDALSVFDTTANTAARFEALAVALGVKELEEAEAASAEEAAERIDHQAVRLRGRRRPMPDMVRHLLHSDPGADTSAHLGRILPRLALARWSLADVRALVAAEPDAPGLEHLRTRRFGTGRRPRPPEEQQARLEHQWKRAVEFAAGLAPSGDRAERDLSGLRAVAAQALEAEADPSWWTHQAGQSDRRVLLAVHLVALTACVTEVDVDVRRVAQLAGVGKSTAHRALVRLCQDARLTQVAPAEGQRSARYRLLPRDQWISPTHPGGTQVEHAPATDTPQQTPLPTREDLLTRLRERLEIAQHDVWAEHSPTHPRGLGRHVELTYAALADQSAHLDAVDLESVAARTGYSTATTVRHLRILARNGLINPVTLAPTTPAASAMDAAAARLGTQGVRAARERRYTAERAVYAAWLTELERLRAPVALRPRVRPGDRYARTLGGDPDHATQLARHLAAA